MVEYKVRFYDNRTEWFNLNGQRHRFDGPAIEYQDDSPSKFWYINGQRHREDGPAVECADGDKWWYLNGKELSEQEFLDRNKVELTLEEIAQKFGIPVNQLKIKK